MELVAIQDLIGDVLSACPWATQTLSSRVGLQRGACMLRSSSAVLFTRLVVDAEGQGKGLNQFQFCSCL